MVPPYMIMDNSSQYIPTLLDTQGDNLQVARQYWKDIPNCCITPVLCTFVLLL